MLVRSPAVAGRFYPADPTVLARDVDRYLGGASTEPAVDARALLAPHAGYVYSGAIAGRTYAAARVPSRAIVICPNHTGLGSGRSVTNADAWAMPGGDVPVDAELRNALVEHADLVPDALAHVREHAVEVQLPFLARRSPGLSFVAVCLGPLAFAECRRMGEAIARAIREVTRNDPSSVLMVASSDMSHYLPADTAERLDALALERIVAFDAEGLHHVVRQHDISMCGYIPTTVTMVTARELGATRGRLVCYGNSGETSGDTDSVVGYAGALMS